MRREVGEVYGGIDNIFDSTNTEYCNSIGRKVEYFCFFCVPILYSILFISATGNRAGFRWNNKFPVLFELFFSVMAFYSKRLPCYLSFFNSEGVLFISYSDPKVKKLQLRYF